MSASGLGEDAMCQNLEALATLHDCVVSPNTTIDDFEVLHFYIHVVCGCSCVSTWYLSSPMLYSTPL